MCIPSVLGESYREAYESVRKVDYMHAKLSFYLMKKSITREWEERKRKKDRKTTIFLNSSLNEACHCVWPGSSLLVLLFALLICMLMYLFYGSTVLIHFKINYPSGTPIPRPGSNVY